MRCPTPLLAAVVFRLPYVLSHGFLSTPRSRNLVAYEDRVYYPLTSDDPLPEDCPNCLNRGGTLARCGVAPTQVRNYDTPRNALGGPMKANSQASYIAGQIIEVEVQLTAHHRGHFEFKACPISNTLEAPSQECFDKHPLIFVRDELYGAPKDENYPSRAYVAPESIDGKILSDKRGFSNAMVFRYQLKLPEKLIGDLVLIQWYYVASNDSVCVHEGYDTYNWPQNWVDSGGMPGNEANLGMGLKPCSEVLPRDGDGIPEQFWNCAEVSITPESEEPQRMPPEASFKPETEEPHQVLSILQDVSIKPETEGPQSTVTRSHDKTIIGYYASWQWYDRNKLAEPKNMDFSKVTRVNFAFFQTNAQGDLWGTDSWADPNLLFGPYNWNPSPNSTEYCSWDRESGRSCNYHFYEDGLISRAHAAGAEVYPSLGGWSLSDPFPQMAASEESRMHFVENCVKLVEDYDFDGLDVDWEYPGYEDHSGTPADTENYNLLLRDLRLGLDQLGERKDRFYGLSAALPCGTKNIANIDIQTVAKYLTELNLMTYDLFGAWSPTTGINAPLYDQDWGGVETKDFSVDGCVRNWVKGGGSPSAINIGIPFYGRSFLRAKGLNETHEGSDRNTWFWDDGTPQFYNIADKLPELVSVRHEPTKTQYAYKNTTMGGLVSYDDEQAICDKTEYCLDNNLNGFIIWELSGDLMPDLSTPLLDALNVKLEYPQFDCKSLAYNHDAGQQNGITSNQPLPAPASTSPTTPLLCPEGFLGTRQHNGCKGYYYCVHGKPQYPITACPVGTLFDERSSLCLYEESVTCSEAPIFTNSSPSQNPSSTEAASIPSQSPMDDTDAPESVVLLGDKEVSKPPPRPVRPALEDPAISVDAPQGIYEPSCPAGYTGVLPFNECTEYFYCINAVPHLPTIRCDSGKLFDVGSNTCTNAHQVRCTLVSGPSSTPSAQPTKQKTNELPASSSTAAVAFDTKTSIPSHAPTKSTTINKNGETTPVISWSSSSTTTHGNNPQPEQSYSGTLGSTSYSWSSSSYSGGTQGLSMAQTFALNSPLITIEISFGDNPGDIGWQLLSLDGKINVAKPTGTYRTPQAIVYETVFLPQHASSTEVQWTIMSLNGRGLGGGHWKIYSEPRSEGSLIAEGADFEFMDSFGFAVINGGQITAKELETPPGQLAIQGQDAVKTRGSLKLDSDADSKKSGPNFGPLQPNGSLEKLAIPLLIALVASALAAGIILFILAYKQKQPAYKLDEDTGSFDDGSWDIERDVPQNDFSADYQDRTIITSSIDPPGSFYNDDELNEDESLHVVDRNWTPDAFYDYVLPGQRRQRNGVDNSPETNESRPVPNNEAAQTKTDVSEITSPSKKKFASLNRPAAGNATATKCNVSAIETPSAAGGKRSEEDGIDKLLEETEGSSKRAFEADIYSILDLLEADEREGQGNN